MVNGDKPELILQHGSFSSGLFRILSGLWAAGGIRLHTIFLTEIPGMNYLPRWFLASGMR
jgi:hypothetical protein